MAESSTHLAMTASALRDRARIRERCAPVSEKRIVSDPEKKAESANSATSIGTEANIFGFLYSTKPKRPGFSLRLGQQVQP
jgi:hypothetical protein